MRKLSPTTVIALAALFVALGGVGIAANGQSLILGQGNSATAQTGLTANASSATFAVTNSSTGSPLKLQGSTSKPPLILNSSTKVANLNADKLDGMDSGGFVHDSVVRRVGPITVTGTTQGTLYPLFTVGPFSFLGFCRADPGTPLQVVDLFIQSSSAHSAYEALTSGGGANEYVQWDMVVQTHYLLASALYGVTYPHQLSRPAIGEALDGDGHVLSFNLYAGENVRGQVGKCVFGGSVITN